MIDNKLNIPVTTLGTALRRRRKQLDVSSLTVSKYVGISAPYYSEIENDVSVPSINLIAKLADALDIEYETLMIMTDRISNTTSKYLKDHSSAIKLLNKLVVMNIDNAGIDKLIQTLDHKPKTIAPANLRPVTSSNYNQSPIYVDIPPEPEYNSEPSFDA